MSCQARFGLVPRAKAERKMAMRCSAIGLGSGSALSAECCSRVIGSPQREHFFDLNH
jgi:hypothetical protein